MAFKLQLALVILAVTLQNAASMSVPASSRHMVGDMMLTQEQFMDNTRKMMNDTRYLWPRNNNTGSVDVPYKIMDYNINVTLLKEAINILTDSTCINFKKLPDEDQTTVSYLSIDQSNKCLAGVGYNPQEATPVSLAGDACTLAGVLHELGHTLAMNHEHSRSDRDNFVQVVMDNIPEKTMKQFKKHNTWNIQPYDYASVLHYGERAGSTDDSRVLLTKDPRFQFIIGEGKTMSFRDIKTINLAYKCMDEFLEGCEKKSDPCKNDGYLGKNCECICRPGTVGSTCQNDTMSYNDAVALQFSQYNQVITKPNTNVTSANYPNSLSTEFRYTQVLRAPKCHRAVLTFELFQVQGRAEEDYTCAFDLMEIRDDVTVADGRKFCASEINKGQVFKSKNQDLILHFKNYNYASQDMTNKNKGYVAKFTTEKIDGCS